MEMERKSHDDVSRKPEWDSKSEHIINRLPSVTGWTAARSRLFCLCIIPALPSVFLLDNC